MRLPIRFARPCVALALLSACVAPAHAQTPACQPLTPLRNQTVVLDQGASYCLAADLRIERGWNLPDAHSSLPAQSLVIVADDVTLDLQGHAIDAGNKAQGIQVRPREDRSGRPGDTIAAPQGVTIRNGTLHGEAGAGIAAGFAALSIPSDRHPYKRPDDLRFFQEIVKARPARPADYQQRNIHIEHLRIDIRDRKPTSYARGGAVNIQGAGTVIRDCVLETDAGTAIWIFGPNAVIENNTIIVHGRAPLREADAPIRLHAADGAVIRNNKFIFRDDANRRGISVFDTGPITVENNVFYGMRENDDVARAFSGTLQMTERGNHVEQAWKAMLSQN